MRCLAAAHALDSNVGVPRISTAGFETPGRAMTSVAPVAHKKADAARARRDLDRSGARSCPKEYGARWQAAKRRKPLRMKAFFVLLGMDIENKGYILPLE